MKIINSKDLYFASVALFFALVYTFVFVHDLILLHGYVTANNSYPFEFESTIPGVYLRPAFFWCVFWLIRKFTPPQS